MSTPSEIRGFFDECRMLAEQSRSIRERLAAMAKSAKDKQIGWQELKSLAFALDADESEKEAKKRVRVSKLIQKSEYTRWYSEILKLGSKDEQHVFTCSSSPAISESAAVPPRSNGGGEATCVPHKPPSDEPRAVVASTLSDDDPLNADIRTTFLSRSPAPETLQ